MKGWAVTTDKLGYYLAAWCVGTAAFSLAYQSQVGPVRFFNEFFLLFPTAHFIYGKVPTKP